MPERTPFLPFDKGGIVVSRELFTNSLLRSRDQRVYAAIKKSVTPRAISGVTLQTKSCDARCQLVTGLSFTCRAFTGSAGFFTVYYAVALLRTARVARTLWLPHFRQRNRFTKLAIGAPGRIARRSSSAGVT